MDRTCAPVGPGAGCMESEIPEVGKAEYCFCEGALCNSAETTVISLTTLLFSLFAANLF